LTGVANPSYTASYAYSNDGLRLRAQESNHASPDRWFQYDGVRPVREGALSGDVFTTTARYEWEGDSYYDALVREFVADTGYRHPLFDGLGSTRQLLDDNQAVTDTYTYEAFGNLMGSSGTTPNPYRYVGSLGYYQTGNSLQHLGARYYLPEVGRFVQPDPIEDERHLYAYCDSRPIVEVDPSGRTTVVAEPVIKIICALLAAAATAVGICTLCDRDKDDVHVRCKKAYQKCVRWCDDYDWDDRRFWDPRMPYKSRFQCKDACDKARERCNDTGDTSIFPHVRLAKRSG
jgi:RHS repeat-associated protein